MAESTISSSAQTDTRPPGIVEKTARLFITSPVTPVLLLVSILLGVLGLNFIPRQEDPRLSVPIVDVFIQYPDAPAGQVSSLVSEPLERVLHEIPGVRHTHTQSRPGSAILTAAFGINEDADESLIKVRDRVYSSLDRLPPGVKTPLVKALGIDDVPVVTLTLWSNDLDDSTLRMLGADVLQQLAEVPGAGNRFIVGGREEQIRVEVSPERLSHYGFSIERVARMLQRANAATNADSIQSSSHVFSMRSGSYPVGIKEVERLVIGKHKGVPVYVRDVATVVQGPSGSDQMAAHYGGAANEGTDAEVTGAGAVTIAVGKKKGANAIVVAEAVLEKVEELSDIGSGLIPANVQVTVSRNYAKTANDTLSAMLRAVLVAALLVSLVCLAGLGVRAGLVVIVTIPVVAMLTIWVAVLLDISMNRVSLVALIFSIGILVDNATVVVDFIFRHWHEKGKAGISIALDALQEVARPTLVAVMAMIAALLPLVWSGGLEGKYTQTIPVLAAVAMLLSLFAAFIFVPWLGMKMAPHPGALQTGARRDASMQKAIRRHYRPFIVRLLNNRKFGLGFLYGISGLAVVLGSALYMQGFSVPVVPFIDRPDFSVVVDMPEGTALAETEAVVTELAEALQAVPEIDALQAYAGTAQPYDAAGIPGQRYLRQQPWQGDLLVMLTNHKERTRSAHEIAVSARELLGPIARRMDARITVVTAPTVPPHPNARLAEVYGPDAEVRRQVAAGLQAMLDTGARGDEAGEQAGEPMAHWRFEINIEQASRAGVSVDTINEQLAIALGGYKVGEINRGRVFAPASLVIQTPFSLRSQPSRLDDLPIPTSNGTTVPLSTIGSFEKHYEDAVIYTRTLRSVDYVAGDMQGITAEQVQAVSAEENRVLDNIASGALINPAEPAARDTSDADTSVYEIRWAHESVVAKQRFRELGIAFMVALLLMYAIIYFGYRNAMLAGLIMSPVPVMLIGVVCGHWMLGVGFTFTSMIGMIALGGISVRQSILMVDAVKIEVGKGMDVTDAAIRGAELRMRPILVTALTLIAAAAVMLIDPVYRGMAISLIFGTAIATIMTFLIIPMGCISAKKQFGIVTADAGIAAASPVYSFEDKQPAGSAVADTVAMLLQRARSALFFLASSMYIALRAVYNLLFMTISRLFQSRGSSATPASDEVSQQAMKSSPQPPGASAPAAASDQPQQDFPAPSQQETPLPDEASRKSATAAASPASHEPRAASAEPPPTGETAISSVTGRRSVSGTRSGSCETPTEDHTTPAPMDAPATPSQETRVTHATPPLSTDNQATPEPENSDTADHVDDGSDRADKREKRRGIRLNKDLL